MSSKSKTQGTESEHYQMHETPSTSFTPFRGRAVWIMLAVATAIRILMLFDFCRSNPLAEIVQGDPGVYWQAAARIASGRFVGETPFQFTPLYPYILAMVRLLGGGLVAVFLCQNVAHLFTGYLLGRLAHHRFGGHVGLVVMSLFFLMQEPAVMVNRLLPGSWQLLLLVSLLAMTSAYMQRPGFFRATTAGLLMGTLTLLYPPAVLLVPVLFYHVWRGKCLADGLSERAGKHGEGRALGLVTPRWQHAIATGGLAMLVLSFATLHNWLACGEFIPITAHAGITLRQGNAPGSDGRYTQIAGVSQTKERMHEDAQRVFHQATGREGSFREIDAYFRDQAWRYMFADPIASLRLMSRKAYWFATGRHYGDIYFPTLEQHDGWLHWLMLAPIPIAWIMMPTMFGLILSAMRRRLLLLDFTTFLLPLVVVVVFWYSPRYRMPVLPMLCLWTGVAFTSVFSMAANQRRYYARALVFWVCIIAGPSLTTWNELSGFDKAASYRGIYEYNRGQLFVGLGQHKKALAFFDEAHKLAPDRPLPLSAMTASLVALGRIDEAMEAAHQLVFDHPELPESWLTLGGLYLRIGQWSKSESAFRSLLDIAPKNSPAHLGIWLALANSGRAQEGVLYLEKAVKLDPLNDLAIAEYGLWLARTGDATRAKPYLLRAVKRMPDRSDIREMLHEISVQWPPSGAMANPR